MNFIPQDQAARYEAQNSLDQTTFIAAGAGTGKTTTIVERIVNAVCDSGSPFAMKKLAAITFTERAAAELRRRIRSSLQGRADSGSEEASTALADFDSAQIGTIHSFAKRILGSFPIEAGLPITFEVQDQASSKLSMHDTASKFVQAFFEELDDSEWNLLQSAGITPSVLREFFCELNDKRLLVNQEDLMSRRQLAAKPIIQEFMLNLNSWFQERRDIWRSFTPGLTEKIESGLLELNTLFETNSELGHDDVARLQGALQKLLTLGNAGGAAAKPFRDEAKLKFAEKLVGLELIPVENLLRHALPSIWLALQEAFALRIRNGQLTFDDLIALAAELIEKNADVRAKLHRDFNLIVVDEFQDTDPLQWKLISLITTEASEASPEPGSLVLVGDAQQSIYSFRGADVSTYLHVADRVGTKPMGGIKKHLQVNFRSNQIILNWVNAAFGHGSIQLGTAFVDLYPAAPNHVSESHAPGVSVVGVPRDGVDYKLEPAYMASVAHQAKAQGWPVSISRNKGEEPTHRAATYSDIVVLIPARTSLDDLLEELTVRGVPYRSSDSSIVFDRPVVRGLIDALRVIAGVHQPLDLWFALKSPLFGCDDAELLAYKRLGGRWNLPFGEISEELVATRVHASLATLARIKRETSSLTPAALIQRLVEDCRVTSTYDQTPRGRFEIECVQMVMRQARSWSQAGGLAVADYLAWLQDQLDENAREALPETDDRNDDAVRISTVHGVKGLEFPIVILSGMGRVRVAKLPKISVKQNRFEFNLAQLKSVGYREFSEPIEIAEIAAEQTRILYVAATRAKDHLVVSNMAKEKADGSTTSWSGLYREAVAETVDVGLAVKFDQFVPPSQNPTLTLRPSFAPESESWLEQLPAIRAKSKAKNLVTPSTRGAKAETDGEPEEATLVDEAFQTPKNYLGDEIAGSDVAELGNALHKVLEVSFGRRATEIDQLVQLSMQQALQEYGVPQFEERLQKMVANVFNHAVIQRIYAADHVMPELEMSEINEDGVLVEGFADLVLREGDSLVVIDYKTNLELGPEKQRGYAQQLDVYAQIIQRATQLVVKEKFLLHVLPEKAELIAV